MKVVILAGGFGTRLCGETQDLPKPMVQIGDKPILWHILQSYSLYGYKEFIIALGRHSDKIKRYFLDWFELQSNFTLDFQKQTKTNHAQSISDWKIHFVDTGVHTKTGGRLLKLKKYIGDESFMLAYGDVLSDVNLNELEAFHRSHNKLATLTAVRTEGRYGELDLCDDQISSFREKPRTSWVSCGFFMLEPEVIDMISSPDTSFERGPLGELAKQGEMMAFKHHGFWHPMDTPKDKIALTNLWKNNQASWLQRSKECVYG